MDLLRLSVPSISLPPTSETAQPEQVEGIIADCAWPDAKSRLELEYLISQSTESATEILEVLLEQEKRRLRQDIIIGLKDRYAATSTFLKHVDSQRAKGIGELLFNEWAAFACKNFLTPRQCPTAWQRMPLDLNKLIEDHRQFLPVVWDFLCERETQILDYQFKLQEIGLDTLTSLITSHLQVVARLEDMIDTELLSDLLSAVLTPPPEMPLIRNDLDFVLSHFSPQEWEMLRVYEYFSGREVRIINWGQSLRAKARQCWSAVLDAWIDQALRDGVQIDGSELKLFLSQMRNAFSLSPTGQPISDELPERLKEAIQRNPILLKQSIITFREKTLFRQHWELRLKGDAAEIRRKMLPLLIKSETGDLDELAKFINESLGEFAADSDALNLEVTNEP